MADRKLWEAASPFRMNVLSKKNLDLDPRLPKDERLPNGDLFAQV